jgi:hypothetical protein
VAAASLLALLELSEFSVWMEEVSWPESFESMYSTRALQLEAAEDRTCERQFVHDNIWFQTTVMSFLCRLIMMLTDLRAFVHAGSFVLFVHVLRLRLVKLVRGRPLAVARVDQVSCRGCVWTDRHNLDRTRVEVDGVNNIQDLATLLPIGKNRQIVTKIN